MTEPTQQRCFWPAVTHNGITFYADEYSHTVQRIAHGKATPTALPEGVRSWLYPRGMVWVADQLHVCDSWNHRIVVLDQDGAFVSTYGSHGSGDGMLESPSDLAVDEAGRIWVCDQGNNRIVIWDQSRHVAAHTMAGLLQPPTDAPLMPAYKDALYPRQIRIWGKQTAILGKINLALFEDGKLSRVLVPPARVDWVMLGFDNRGLLLLDRPTNHLLHVDLDREAFTSHGQLPDGFIPSALGAINPQSTQLQDFGTATPIDTDVAVFHASGTQTTNTPEALLEQLQTCLEQMLTLPIAASGRGILSDQAPLDRLLPNHVLSEAHLSPKRTADLTLNRLSAALNQAQNPAAQCIPWMEQCLSRRRELLQQSIDGTRSPLNADLAAHYQRQAFVVLFRYIQSKELQALGESTEPRAWMEQFYARDSQGQEQDFRDYLENLRALIFFQSKGDLHRAGDLAQHYHRKEHARHKAARHGLLPLDVSTQAPDWQPGNLLKMCRYSGMHDLAEAVKTDLSGYPIPIATEQGLIMDSYRGGNFKSCLTQITRPHRPSLYPWEAQLHGNLGQWDAAEETIAEVGAQYDVADAMYAKLAILRQDYQHAETLLSRYDVASWMTDLRILTQLFLGRAQAALDLLDHLGGNRFVLRGFLLGTQDRFDEALDSLNQAPPAFLGRDYHRGLIHRRMGDAEAALAAFDRDAALLPSWVHQVQRILTYRRFNRGEEAAKALQTLDNEAWLLQNGQRLPSRKKGFGDLLDAYLAVEAGAAQHRQDYYLWTLNDIMPVMLYPLVFERG